MLPNIYVYIIIAAFYSLIHFIREKRRLAIGSELLDSSISILLLDEPTSGLDAAAAQNIANLLRSLSDQGMSITTTLHQPRQSIMSRFDSVMVMASGSAIYYGPRESFESYLTTNLQCTIPLHESPYDLLLDALNPAIAEESIVNIGVVSANFEGDLGAKLATLFDNSGMFVYVYVLCVFMQ